MCEIIKVRFSKSGKIFHWVSTFTMIILYGIVFYQWPNENWNNENMLVLMVFLFPILVYFSIDGFKLQVVVTNNHIERIGVRKKRIRFSEITSIIIGPRRLSIKSTDTSIRIESSVSDFSKIMVEVCNRIRDNKNIKATGDKKLLLELLGIQS